MPPLRLTSVPGNKEEKKNRGITYIIFTKEVMLSLLVVGLFVFIFI